ncbi:MAG: hypothetical protein ACR2LK_02385 [Solirubrobacteraceae bacterium]
MSPSKLRVTALIAAAGGACWLALVPFAIVNAGKYDPLVLDTAGGYLQYGLFTLSLALTVPALLALHLHQGGADGRLGRAGALVAIAGVATQCVVIAAIVAAGQETSWFGTTAPIAIATWFIGSILLAIAIRRARLMPGWVAIALPVVTLLAIVGAEFGTSVLIGLFQVGIGLRIARAADARATRASGSLGSREAELVPASGSQS